MTFADLGAIANMLSAVAVLYVTIPMLYLGTCR